jgi:hypothetical protein
MTAATPREVTPMTTHPARSRVKTAALALCGVAAIATAACAATAPAAAAGRSQPAAVAVAATTSVPVVVTCAMKARTRPRQYVLACGDGNAYLGGLTWAAWGSSSAFAEGTFTLNDCVPYCAAGHFHGFRALVALWGAEPRPGHAGERYFTRLTIIYTGSHAYHADGKLYRLPGTETYPLSALGGA